MFKNGAGMVLLVSIIGGSTLVGWVSIVAFFLIPMKESIMDVKIQLRTHQETPAHIGTLQRVTVLEQKLKDHIHMNIFLYKRVMEEINLCCVKGEHR